MAETPGAERPRFITGLLDPAAYPHPATDIRLAETHISWVLLAGDFAYKIKKPVDFGFLDFSTPERRRACCEAEVRLNRRYAPDLYLAVVPIAGDAEHPRMDAPGPVLDHAVKMRRFAPEGLFDHLADTHRLLPEHIDRLAATLAAFHAACDRATAADAHGLPRHQQQAAEFNFQVMRPLLDDPGDSAKLDALEAWTQAEYARREATLGQRKREGFIRECHGDLHLGNIVLIDGRPTLFDGIEFNEDLRWIDTLSELAFIAMDLESRHATALAYRLLNRYLEATGDYPGLVLWNYYRLYRALVRAKIALLSRAQSGDSAQRAAWLARCRGYIDYGLALIRPRRPALLITHGVSGSGKSHFAARLAERLPAFRIRSDVERKRLVAGSLPATNPYGAEMTTRTYRHLADMAAVLLGAGHSVIADATFLERAQRAALRKVAAQSGAAFAILDCRAPVAVLRERIRARALAGDDPSEADEAVLECQLARREPLDAAEQAFALAVNSAGEQAMEGVLAGLAGSGLA